MKLRPCPICQTPMVARKIGTHATATKHAEYFIYCRHCGYGPVQTFDSLKEAAQHWEHESLAECLHS